MAASEQGAQKRQSQSDDHLVEGLGEGKARPAGVQEDDLQVSQRIGHGLGQIDAVIVDGGESVDGRHRQHQQQEPDDDRLLGQRLDRKAQGLRNGAVRQPAGHARGVRQAHHRMILRM